MTARRGTDETFIDRLKPSEATASDAELLVAKGPPTFMPFKGRVSNSTDVVVEDPPRTSGVLGTANGHATAFCVHLPLPPSTNQLWNYAIPKRPRGSGMVYKNPKYARWRSTASWAVKAALNGVKGLADAYVLRVRAIRPDEVGRDLDNLLKPLCDALVDGGVIQSDKLAKRIEIEWVTAEDLGGVGEGMEVLLLATNPLPVATNKLPEAIEARKAKARVKRAPKAQAAATTVRAGTPKARALAHDINCEWQLDQYDHECTCGVTRPRAPWFVPYNSEGKAS